ncbi:MAG: DUF433 domain-containing protein [Verrucomicrobia bacterium]|nr:DUF433 domain-containing protein [Verrucomicrobiota bacterium]
MSTTTAPVDIGSLITGSPEIKGGNPRIAGTGVTVQRIVGWYKLGFDERSDEDQLLWATSAGRVIYTINARHFCRLHRTFLEVSRDHAGIIIGQQQRFSIGEQLR